MVSASLTLWAAPPLAAGSWRNRLLALALMLFAFSCLAVGSQQNGATPVLERSVKAAFLYKFLGYMEFASDPGPTLVVGVLGADEVAAQLAQISSGRSVGNRSISVRKLSEGDALGGLNLLFVGSDASLPEAALRAAERTAPSRSPSRKMACKVGVSSISAWLTSACDLKSRCRLPNAAMYDSVHACCRSPITCRKAGSK